MRRFQKSMSAAALGLVLSAAWLCPAYAVVKRLTLPDETAALREGPDQDVAVANCTGCHSPDYIATQPPLGPAFWRATVTKMIKVYGAPITDADLEKIVGYLTKAYPGKPGV